ncbi:unnamed protein product, partial [Mesorhabditis spiculigera]
MFHLSPITLKPEVRAKKDQHPIFEKQLLALIHRIAQEKEVVQIDQANAKKLLNMLDTFLGYGLFACNKCYWPFVREFLPKTETQLLKVEWQCTSDRALSIAWLKDALNRGSFHFQMLAIQQNKKLVNKYYHPNSCMRNQILLKNVTVESERLTNVMFSFVSPTTAAQEFVPAAVVVESTPVVTMRRQRITKKIRNRLESESEPPVQAPTMKVSMPTAMDTDFMLGDLLNTRNQKNKLIGQQPNGTTVDVMEPRTSQEVDEPVAALDILISKRNMSGLFGSMGPDAVAASFDSLFELPSTMKETMAPPEETKVDGEVFLQANESLQLSMDVFTGTQAESLLKCYQVFETFVVGRPAERLLAITESNVYILSQTVANFGAENEEVAETLGTSVEYHTHCQAPMEAIDYLGLSDDAQCVLLFAKKDIEFAMHDVDRLSGKVVSIAAGDMKLGKVIADEICRAAEKGGRQGGAPPIFSDTTPYSLIVRRFLKKELKAEAPKVKHTSAVFWRETSVSATGPETSHQGYLMHRSLDLSWWKRPNDDWKQSYFLLQGSKLYVFTDSTCKFGERVISLSGGAVETHEVELKKNHSFGLQIIFPDRPEEAPLQLQCTSREEMGKWMHLLSIALSSPEDGEDAVSCALILTDTHLVICQEGEKLLRDEFMRALLVLRLDELLTGVAIVTEHHTCLVIEANDIREWFFFRTDAELKRACKALEANVKIQDLAKLNDDKLCQVLKNQARRVPDRWHRTVFGAEHNAINRLDPIVRKKANSILLSPAGSTSSHESGDTRVDHTRLGQVGTLPASQCLLTPSIQQQLQALAQSQSPATQQLLGILGKSTSAAAQQQQQQQQRQHQQQQRVSISQPHKAYTAHQNQQQKYGQQHRPPNTSMPPPAVPRISQPSSYAHGVNRYPPQHRPTYPSQNTISKHQKY